MNPEHPLVDVVRSDLQFLRDEWDQEVDDHSLRRSSPVLRRLLVDGDLQRAWKLAGNEREPVIRAIDLDAVLDRVDPGNLILLATAGGATFRGVTLMGTLLCKPGRFTKAWDGKPLMTEPSWRDFGLSSFVSGSAGCFENHRTSRRRLIKYVANTLGGTHYDEGRNESGDSFAFTILDVALQEGSPFPDSEGRGVVRFAGKPVVYFELLSIGQAISSIQLGTPRGRRRAA